MMVSNARESWHTVTGMLASKHRDKVKCHRDPWILRMRTMTQQNRFRGHYGSVTATTLRQLLKKQNYRCALTGDKLTIKNCTLDHIVPFGFGGPHTIENVQLVTAEANRAKGSMSQCDFLRLCRRVLKTNGK